MKPKDIIILPPADVLTTLNHISFQVTTTILDPWYNKGVGGQIDGYDQWLRKVVTACARFSQHVFVWGFPEIVHRLLNEPCADLEFVSWLTWYYKNCPSVIRGWRSSQYACLHFAKPSAPLYPEHFLNDAQLTLQEQGKLRYMPGPASVIEAPLNVGFVGREEQTGHPAQKPIKVFEPLVQMTTKPGQLVLDPFCGSGTTGVVCKNLGRRAILSDILEEYVALTESRLDVKREENGHWPKYFLKNSKISLFSRSVAPCTTA